MGSDAVYSRKLDEDEEEEKIYYLFGHDIRTISCLRTTMITSFSTAIGTTLGTFLFTSDGFRSARYGLFACSMLMLPLWLNCARKDLADEEALRQTRQRLKERTGEQYTILDSLESFGSDSYG